MNDIHISKNALLDKLTLFNVEIVKIEDIEKLKESGIFEQKTVKGVLRDFVKVDRVKEKGYFFKSGYTGLGDYGILQTNIINKNYGNLMCYSMEQYKNFIEIIKKDLQESYGITINTDFLKVSKMEINKTFPIDGTMGEYERVFELLMAIIPANARLKVKTTIANEEKGKAEENTFYATSNKTGKSKCFTEWKWYNKTKQLFTCYQIRLDENYVRLEITLCGSKRIKAKNGLETNIFFMLSDELINEWFDKKIHAWIVEPIKKWRTEQEKKVKKIMRDCKKEDGYRWIDSCITRILNEEIDTCTGHKPLILDVEEVIPLINAKMYPDTDRRKRARKALRKYAKEHAWNLTKRDDLKLLEILDKLELKEPMRVPTNEPLEKVG